MQKQTNCQPCQTLADISNEIDSSSCLCRISIVELLSDNLHLADTNSLDQVFKT